MYLLKHFVQYNRPQIYPHLHSTMYLLKHNLSQTNNCSALYLHSTMYLLKLRLSCIPTACLTKFTFHYVSIKTHLCSLQFLFQKDLHSTMYLLKLLSISVWISDLTNLHSTMYLLKRIFPGNNESIKGIYIPLCIY